ncbi:MAG: mechanosensitive ion channel [Pseudomonadota bacterium]|nr:mechanosensitive ion channel [Pseudomonadota bacterium]
MQIGNYRWDNNVAMAVAEQAVYAVAILIITWALAKAAKWAFATLVDKVSLFKREDGSGQSIGMSLGRIASLLVWLFGLLAILQVLGLPTVAAPINSLLNDVMGFIPNLVGAGLLLFIGLMIAGIVRDIAVTAMQTINLDKWANKGGVDEVTGNTTISKTLGTVIYALIAIPVAIGALGVLNIAAISVPATEMLSLVMAAIPNIIAAALLLGIGYMISKFLVGIISELLAGLGIDMPIAALGVLPGKTKASDVIARIVQIAIILFFAIAATRLLGFPELTAILDEILAQGGSVLFGAVVIGVGFLIANVVAKFVGAGTMQGNIIRYATILVFTFMGLRKMQIGEEIVDIAFGAVVIGLAVAGSLAFGLGGRDWAAKKLEEMDRKKS